MSLEQTQQHKQTVAAIHDIVSAMRAIAAGRIQSAQHALANAKRCQDLILSALASLPTGSISLPPTPAGQQMLMVMTSEQPFCGGFNQNILELAEKRWRDLQGDVDLILVGRRGVQQVTARGIVPEETIPATTSLQGVRNLVRRLAELVDDRYASGRLAGLRIIYSRYLSVSEQEPTEEILLPFNLELIASTNGSAVEDLDHYLPIPDMVAGLLGEQLFITLYRIAVESYASEQASRLIAMDGATRNSQKMLDSLADLERRQRQEEVTQQVLELIAARFAAVS